MSLRRAFVSILFTFSVAFVSVSTSTAQSSTTGSGPPSTATGLLVPVSGVADAGSMFRGTLLVQRFLSQGNSVAAAGTVAGVLTAADGSVRTLLFQATLPLDVDSSRARLNTDPALAEGSCGVLDVDLAATEVNVLGSTLDLNPVAFDIASAVQAGASTSSTTSTATAGSQSAAAASAPQAATLTTPLSTNTTQASPTPQFTTTIPTPGPTPVPAASTPRSAQMNLANLLCAVDGFRNVSNPTQLVQQLNGIVTALAGGGS